jgi:hypothetical protein
LLHINQLLPGVQCVIDSSFTGFELFGITKKSLWFCAKNPSSSFYINSCFCSYFPEVGSGAPSSNDPKFERRPPAASWPTFQKTDDAKFKSSGKFGNNQIWFSWSKFNNKKNRGLWAILGDYQEDSYWGERKSNLKIDYYKKNCRFILKIVHLKKKNFSKFWNCLFCSKNLRILSRSNLRTEFPSSKENDFFCIEIFMIVDW